VFTFLLALTTLSAGCRGCLACLPRFFVCFLERLDAEPALALALARGLR